MPFAGFEDMDACMREHSDKESPGAYCAQIHYEVTGEWPAEKYEKQFGSEPLFEMPIEVAEKMVEVGDVPLGTWKQTDVDDLNLLTRYVQAAQDPLEVKETFDMVKLSRTDEVSDVISKADTIDKVGFDAQVNRSVQMVFKQDDEFLIWGPASVEIVDKEQDKISVDALDKALPQLLKRARLSYNHTDQIVGRILENFETEEPVDVTIDGKTYKRNEFPTDVLELEEDDNPALYVAGEVFDDTQQASNVRKEIEQGSIDSYSISGEALVTQKQVDGSMVYDDILEMDLSAVTLCEEGMNQEAKFARVNADSESIETAEKYQEDFEVTSGSVSQTQQAIAKSMSDDNTSGLNPEDFVKADEVEGEIASKQYVNDELGEAVSKTVDAVVDELDGSVVKEEQFEEKARSVVQQELNGFLPKGDLVTRSFVESKLKEDYDYEEEEDDEEEKGDYEEDDDEDDDEMERADDEMEEEEMMDEMEDDDMDDESMEEDKAFTRQELEEELPGDVWSVVSEYVGDSKRVKSNEQPENLTEDDLEKAVQSVLKGEAVQSPGIDMDERADELDELYKDDEDGDVDTASPALDKWN